MSVNFNWIVDNDGLVYDKQLQRIGFFDLDGMVYAPDLRMKYGFVDINGDTYGELNSIKGFVDIDGTIYDEYKTAVGYADTHGVVYNSQRTPIGNVRMQIHQTTTQKDEAKHKWQKTIYRAAAGVVLLLRKR
jgi:hypothetical protein